MKQLLLLLIFLPIFLAAQSRLALVIGNAEYKSIGKLDAPENDADDMANLLKECGFDVMKIEKNISRDEMEKAINAFGSKLKKQQGVGLFYYSGHGMEESGKNYLMPISFPSSISYKHDIARQAVPLELIKNVMIAAGNGQNIILLDACRTEIIIEDDTKAPRLGSSIKSGEFKDAQNVFIGYATNAGTDAIDGVQKRNSPFTEVLMRVIRSNKGTELVDIYRKVIAEVQKKYPQQHPTPEGITSEPFYFIPINENERLYKQFKPECDKYFAREEYNSAKVCYEIILNHKPKDEDCESKILFCNANLKAISVDTLLYQKTLANAQYYFTLAERESERNKNCLVEKHLWENARFYYEMCLRQKKDDNISLSGINMCNTQIKHLDCISE